jgi:hypothetical protein
MTFPTVAVTVNLATLAGVNQAGVTVTATLDRDDVYLGVIVQSQVSGVTDASGNVVLQLFPNNPTTGLGTTGSVYYFFASIPLIGNFHALAQVPNSACNLATIANLAPVNGVFTVSGLQIWNSASQVFTGATLNITDTASQASSLFVDYQISGVSKFSVRKDGGFVTLGGTSSSFPALRRTGTGVDIRLADDSGYGALAAAAIALSGGTVTASAPLINNTQTWNNAAVTFAAEVLNVTDTLSAAGSLLADWQVNGVSKLSADKGGNVTLAGLLRFAGATAAFPALRRTGSGLDVVSADASAYVALRAGDITVNGALYANDTLLAGTSGAVLKSSAFFGWSSAVAASSGPYDVLLYRGGPGILEQRNGANPQTFNLYGSYTDGSNYSRASFRQNGSNFSIFTEQLGTGGARPLQLGTVGAVDVSIFTTNLNTWDFKAAGHLYARTDNALDFGALSANRPRSIYAGTSVVSPIVTTTAQPVASLPAAVDGTRAFVTDSTVAFTSANVGATVAGGGANQCPVVRIAGVWKIAG